MWVYATHTNPEAAIGGNWTDTSTMNMWNERCLEYKFPLLSSQRRWLLVKKENIFKRPNSQVDVLGQAIRKEKLAFLHIRNG